MKIQNSNINMYAHSSDKEKLTAKRTLIKQQEQPENMNINQQFKEQLRQLKNEVKQASKTEKSTGTFQLSEKDLQKIRLLERILSELTGKEVKFLVPKEVEVDDSKYDGFVHQAVSKGPVRVFKEEVSFEKKSSFSFSASGSVTTEDGRQIQFDLSMKEQRYIKYERSTTMTEGQLMDPLAISFDGRLPQLTDEKYSFDIDFDGREDQISFLTKGSGFLAFDKNNDGKINDGRELFGPTSGSGFADLAAYDQDSNGWIDENDDIFNKLRIWTKDDEGNDQLVGLGEKGVGAIFLGSVASHFDLLGSNLAKNGQVKQSGIYLNENGTAGSLHHVDIQL